MDDASLIIHQYLTSSKDKRQLFTSEGYGKVKLQARIPYKVKFKVNYIIPEREVKQRSVQHPAFLDFPVGVSKIRPDYRRNPKELQAIAENIGKIYQNDYLKIDRIYLEGYASPEGSYQLNERLSRERAEALKIYLTQRYSIPSAILQISSVAEDWEGLRALIEAGEIGNKESILNIINSYDELDVKERRLRALPQWRTLLNEYFTQLRRTDYRIDFTVKDFSLAESHQFIESNPELFSHLELYNLAMSYQEPMKRMDILEKIVQNYPDDPIAINNYVAALLENEELASAKRYLERIQENELLNNNRGVYFLLVNELKKLE